MARSEGNGLEHGGKGAERYKAAREAPVASGLTCTKVWRRNQHSPYERCTEPPVLGTSHCARHGGRVGGRADRARSKAARRLTGGALKILMDAGLDRFAETVRGWEELDVGHVLAGVRVAEDPGELLLEEAFRTAQVVRNIEEELEAMTQEGIFAADAEIETSETKVGGGAQGDYTLTKVERSKKVHQLWEVYSRERKHLAEVCAAALRSGIEERRIRLQERSVDALEVAMATALEQLGIDPHDERVRLTVGEALREALEGPTRGAVRFFGNEDRVLAVGEGMRTAHSIVEGSVDAAQEGGPRTLGSRTAHSTAEAGDGPKPVKW